MQKQIGSARFLLTLVACVVVSIALVAASACSSGNKTSTPATSTTSSATVSFSNDVQPIFNNNCVVCHQGASATGGMSLEPSKSYSMLVGVQSSESSTELRVKPGAPAQSYLLAKLNGTQAAAGGSGAQMPYGGTSLSATLINTIQQWIAEGAPNN